MEIVQKKLNNTHTFRFEDEFINFAYKDKSGSGDFDLYYADFPEKSSITIEQNEWLRNVGILWGLLGCYDIASDIYSGSSLSVFWLGLGLICLVCFFLTKVKYSVFKTEQGNAFIIKDSKHENIISEIDKRKKAQLLMWYGEINLENELDNELKKFDWLVQKNVITQSEAAEKKAQVELAHSFPNASPDNLN